MSTFFAGMCEICHFPFRAYGNTDPSKDCVTFDIERGLGYCSPAVYKSNLWAVGIPYDWTCPKKESHESLPTCFVSGNTNR